MSRIKGVKKVDAYSCRLCGRVFTGEKAREIAHCCAMHGIPKYRYRKGMIFRGQFFWQGILEVMIVKKNILQLNEEAGHSTHEAGYTLVRLDTGEFITDISTEKDITRELRDTPQHPKQRRKRKRKG